MCAKLDMMCCCAYDLLQHSAADSAIGGYHDGLHFLILTCIVAGSSHSMLVWSAVALLHSCQCPTFSPLMLHARQAARPPPQQAAAHLPLSPVYKSSCEQFARPLEEPQVHFLVAGMLPGLQA